MVHADPQLINIAVLTRKMCEAKDSHMRRAWSTAVVEDIAGSLLVKLLFLPGLARIMYAIGLRGEDWHAVDPTESLLQFDCTIILIQAAMFSASELALYAVRPSPEEHNEPPPIILNISSVPDSPASNNYVFGFAITITSKSYRYSSCLLQRCHLSFTTVLSWSWCSLPFVPVLP